MTRAPRGTRPAPTPGGTRPAPSPRGTRDPYGLLPAGAPIAAVISIVGLLFVVVATLGFSNGDLPFVSGNGGTGPNGSGNPGVARTPTPSNIVNAVTPPPDTGIKVPGTLVYAKDGNIWIQSGDKATQLTDGGTDSMPSFAPDGASVYFVRTRHVTGYWPVNGRVTRYQMDVPSVMQVPITGGDAVRIMDGMVDPTGKLRWMGFIREPVLSPDGRYIAMATDLPDPTTSDVIIKLYDTKTKRIKNLGLAQVPPLGHQDPAWRPDGARLLYVLNNRDGAKGAPTIYAYTPATGKTRPVTGPGYLHPSWSPDGRYFAATRTSAFGTDVVILNASTGAELLRLTNDGQSWAPVWSPAGDQIAYLHVSGQVVDLRMIQLEGSAPSWTMKDPVDLTTSAGLDGISRPGWFIPADQLPASPPPSSAPASPSAS